MATRIGYSPRQYEMVKLNEYRLIKQGNSPSSHTSFSETHLHPSQLRQKTGIWCVTSKAHPGSNVSQSHYENDRTRFLDPPARRRKKRFATSRKLKKDASDWNIRISQDSEERNTEWTTSLNSTFSQNRTTSYSRMIASAKRTWALNTRNS